MVEEIVLLFALLSKEGEIFISKADVECEVGGVFVVDLLE
jgi:hypothetical protein